MQLVIVAAALLGLAVGSFLNVVIARVPAGESVVRPASRCPACGHTIRARHNVPVLGWLMLRGRCADCSAPISVQYPLIELATGAAFAATALAIL
jgi:leader peptidase (prepilin peptidase)/N-methyltransferase